VSDVDGTVFCMTSTDLTHYTLRSVSVDGQVKWSLPLIAYMKWGGMSISKDGYLLISDTGHSFGLDNSIFVVE
jgi:hypothetical protein